MGGPATPKAQKRKKKKNRWLARVAEPPPRAMEATLDRGVAGPPPMPKLKNKKKKNLPSTPEGRGAALATPDRLVWGWSGHLL
jgi:hypothetical protein